VWIIAIVHDEIIVGTPEVKADQVHPNAASAFVVSLLRIYLQHDAFPICCAQCPSLNFRKDFFCRIFEDCDSNRSALYEVLAATGLSECLLIVECQAAFAVLRYSAGYSKALAMRTRALLTVTSTRDDGPGLGQELISWQRC
jgi:hypothetical protein